MINNPVLELSTKILIEEAIVRNINVEILDGTDNFIRLKKVEKLNMSNRQQKQVLILIFLHC